VIPILFYDNSLSNVDSADRSGLGTIFDLTRYLPFSNLNELIRFNIESAGKWLLGILVFRTLCKNFCFQDNPVRLTFIRFWIFGVLISVSAQILQFFGIFPASMLFSYDYRTFNGRFPGLSDHPNTIAIIVCMSIPLLYLSSLSSKSEKFVIALFVISELLSQSRIGIVTFALTLLLCNWRMLQQKIVYFFVFTLGAILLALLYKLELFNSVLDASRFDSSNIDSQKSNEGRWILMKFGMNTFLDNPIFGVGPRAFKESHNIFIQVLSSLGICGFVGFIDFLVRPLLLKYDRGFEPFLARICIFSFLVFGLFNNKLNDFYLYFPLILSLQVLANRRLNQESASN
jgi:O-antigen ligase